MLRWIVGSGLKLQKLVLAAAAAVVVLGIIQVGQTRVDLLPEYHPAHISRLLAGWGFSLQKPQRQAVQRDEAAIREWREQRFPAIEKRGRKKAAPSCS